MAELRLALSWFGSTYFGLALGRLWFFDFRSADLCLALRGSGLADLRLARFRIANFGLAHGRWGATLRFAGARARANGSVAAGRRIVTNGPWTVTAAGSRWRSFQAALSFDHFGAILVDASSARIVGHHGSTVGGAT